MIILNLLTKINFAEGFGFNGNILETNLINLAVVIAVVVSFGGDALRSLLESRKQTILNNFKEADQRANEAQEKLNQAKLQLQLAQQKANEIRQQALITAEQEKKQSIKQTEEDTLRLEEFKQETLRFLQQKTMKQVSQQVIFLALKQVREKIKKRVDSNFHVSVNNFNIALFTNYQP
jgi:F-type H+-transporting ATPase subunit b